MITYNDTNNNYDNDDDGWWCMKPVMGDGWWTMDDGRWIIMYDDGNDDDGNKDDGLYWWTMDDYDGW